MLTERKKMVKIKNLKNKHCGVWYTGNFPQNLALICLTVSEKMDFMDERRTDGRRTAKKHCPKRIYPG